MESLAGLVAVFGCAIGLIVLFIRVCDHFNLLSDEEDQPLERK